MGRRVRVSLKTRNDYKNSLLPGWSGDDVKRAAAFVALMIIGVVGLELASTISTRTIRQVMGWAVLASILLVPIGLWLIWRFLHRMDRRQSKFEKWIRILVGKDDDGDDSVGH